MKSLLIILSFFNFSVYASPLNCSLQKLKVEIAKNYNVSSKADFEDIKQSYLILKKLKKNPYSIKIDAKRLINEADWEIALSKSKSKSDDLQQSWLYYGENTILDWERGEKFIQNLDPKTKATPELLKTIHTLTAENLSFHGFEGRRILKLYENKNITHAEFKTLLQKAYKENKELHNIPHKELKGVFRSSDYDNITHRGSSFTEHGQRYFLENEVDAMLNNKYIQANEDNFQAINNMNSSPGYLGEVKYLSPEKVEAAVSEILQNTEKLLDNNPPLDEVVKIIEQMKVDLISVHPFLDGNGRTIRLLQDFLLRRHGLPPALHPNEMDLIFTVNQNTEETRKQMIRYLNEHYEDYIKTHSLESAN